MRIDDFSELWHHVIFFWEQWKFPLASCEWQIYGETGGPEALKVGAKSTTLISDSVEVIWKRWVARGELAMNLRMDSARSVGCHW